ncbi:MAG: threonine ammonia-lyase [Candidatus Limnocylindrales bacterium]
MISVPGMTDVLEARRRISMYVQPTPLYSHPALCELLGTEVWVKHENHQPISAFKVRGGINLISRLSEEEKRAGVATASTGNHGQSIAYAARLFGVNAVIVVPQGANPLKVKAMERFGAQVVASGKDFDEAREHCARLSAENGYRMIHVANEPLIVAGVATQTLEILEAQPDIDVIIGPVGGGSGMAGACIVAGAIATEVRLIGAQAAAAPAAYRSWREHKIVEDMMGTAAEGVATRVGFEFTQRILWERLNDFILVSEVEIRDATKLMIEGTKTLVEAAGAIPLAAALQIRDRLAGLNVALICTGGNISPDQLRDLYA